VATIENRTRLKDGQGNERIVPERATLRLSGTLLDDAGLPIPSAALTTLTLTLYAPEVSGTPIINGRNGTNILNDGVLGVVHASNGTLTLTLTPADGVLMDAGAELELHRALIQWTYGAGGSKGSGHEIEWPVRNLLKVS
jgi:hypothetical protein